MLRWTIFHIYHCNRYTCSQVPSDLHAIKYFPFHKHWWCPTALCYPGFCSLHASQFYTFFSNYARSCTNWENVKGRIKQRSHNFEKQAREEISAQWASVILFSKYTATHDLTFCLTFPSCAYPSSSCAAYSPSTHTIHQTHHTFLCPMFYETLVYLLQNVVDWLFIPLDY